MSTGLLKANLQVMRRWLLDAIIKGDLDEVRELRAAIAQREEKFRAKNQAMEQQYQADMQAAAHG